MSGPVFVAVFGQGEVPPTAPVFRADDPGATRGDGCFETLRVVITPRGTPTTTIDTPEEHLTRLQGSLRTLDIHGVDVPAVWAWMLTMLEVCASRWTAPGAAMTRLTVTRGAPGAGPSVVLHVTPEAPDNPAARRGVTAVTLTSGRPARAFADAPWLLGGVKSLSYAINFACLREARRRGAHDAIMVSTDGYVMEAATAGVVVLRDGLLRATPGDGTGVLASTTVRDLFASIEALPAHERDGVTGTVWELTTLDDARTADGLWLASSVRGLCPVLQLDDAPVRHDVSVTALLNGLGGWS